MERGQAIAATLTAGIAAATFYFANHHYTAAVLCLLAVGFLVFAVTKKRPVMKVVASATILAELEEGWTPCFQVVLENHSSGELTFSRGCAGVQPLGSKTTFKMWNIVNEVVWPNRLAAGSSLTLMTRLSELKMALRQQKFYLNTELRAVVVDDIGRIANSDWFKIPDEEYFNNILNRRS
jgi:hypothetical protein